MPFLAALSGTAGLPAAAAISGAATLGAAGLGGYFQNLAGKNASQTEMNAFAQASGIESPWITGGMGAYNQYLNLTGAGPGGNPLTAPLTKPFDPSMLASTPGYQFTLGQGLKSTQNSFAAEGLGSSGAAEKGSAAYTTGLAQSTYNQQFQNYLTQNQQIGNMLLAPAGIGAQAANTLAGGALSTGAQIGSNTLGQGNSLGGAAVGGAGGISNALMMPFILQLLQSKLGQSSGGGNALASTPMWGGGAFQYGGGSSMWPVGSTG